MEEKIKRINELARKAKECGLTESERQEQAGLRNEYIKQFRESLRVQLDSIKVVDENGTDVTPRKFKEVKNKNDLH